ncbi:MAG: MATE family efflux transporter [Eubacteriales bacterium]|nr:MATE family efflux transporter [Eubacteriales bacterium]
MNSNQDFTTGNIGAKMLNFMMPILAALVLQAMYGAVDLLIVGRFGTTAGMSGVSTGSSIMNMFTFSVAALTTALTVVMGTYLGQKKPERIGRLLGGGICFFAVLSIVMGVLLMLLARPIAVLMQAPAEALDYTVVYIRICGAGFVFIVFYNLISAVFRGMGDSVSPLIFVGIACAVNIVGDLALVAGLHMNAAGAAIATVVAQAVSVVISILIIRKKTLPFTITKRDIGFNEEIPRFVMIGLPLALQEVLTNITFLALCAFVNRLGLDASSGYGVAQKIQSFVMLIPSSIMQSMSSVVAQNVGARLEERARNAMKIGILVGGVIGIVIFLGVFFKGDVLAELFTEDAAVISRAFEYLKGFAPESIVTVVLFSYMGYFNGHQKSMFVMAQSLAQSFLIRLPMSYIMSIRPGASLTGIGLAAPCATCFGIVLCFIYDRIKIRRVRITGRDDV